MRRTKFVAAVMLLLGVAVVGSVYAASKILRVLVAGD